MSLFSTRADSGRSYSFDAGSRSERIESRNTKQPMFIHSFTFGVSLKSDTGPSSNVLLDVPIRSCRQDYLEVVDTEIELGSGEYGEGRGHESST